MILRWFETVVLVTLPFLLLSLFLPATLRSEWLVLLPAVALISLAGHLLVEGHRWQMWLAYGLTAVFSILALQFTLSPVQNVPLIIGVLGFFFGGLFLLAALALPLLFPIFRLPTPTGSYSVGTTLFTVLNQQHDLNSTVANQKDNEIVVQAWYPAELVAGRPHPYLANAPFPWDWVRLVPTNSILDAPLSGGQAKYPVLLFCHGGGFMAVQNTMQMEALASHGYVVLSVSHLQDSAVTVFPDGRNDGRSLRQLWREMQPVLADNNAAFKTAAPLTDPSLSKTMSLAEKKAIMRQIFEENGIALEVINRRASNIYAVIDYLEAINMTEGTLPFSGRLALNRLGILGHSNGGAVAVNVAFTDKRIGAVLNMDGYLFGEVFEQGLQRPFMSMSKEGSEDRDAVVYEQTKAPVYNVTIQGANHFNFMDIFLWMPRLNSRFMGAIDPMRAMHIVNRYALAFFDKHLCHEDDALLDKPSPQFPEVLFDLRKNH